jgi:simple sugar transport system permease protein
MMLFAALAGMAWIIVPLWLRVRWRVNEIIVTLLLNYVAFNFLLHLLYGAWLDPKDNFPHSPQFRAFERLPELGFGVSSALVLALIFTALSGWLVMFTRFGFYTKFVHDNDRMALAVGVPIGLVTLVSALLSGALSALAGFVIAAAQEGRLTQSYFEGYGFSGILIAFLARNNPIAAMVVAILVAVLFVSGRSLQVFYQIPFAMVQLIQAIIVISVAASEFLMRHRVHWVR